MLDAGNDPSSLISILDALHFIAKAWKNIKKFTLPTNCFLKAFKDDVNCELPEQKEEESLVPATWDKLQPSCTLQDFISVDKAVVMTADQVTAESANSDGGDDKCIADVPTSAEAM